MLNEPNMVAGPGPKPPADVFIDADLVRELVAEQFPDLYVSAVSFADDGWDNAVFRLGRELAVRLPRRAEANELLRSELRWLPEVAPRLPLPVPTVLRRGTPGCGYPYAWSIVPWFEGVSAASVPAVERDAYAVELAGFMRAMHVPAPAEAPVNPARGVPLMTRDAGLRERLASGVFEQVAELTRIWEESLAASEHTGPALWLHGDPHPHNLLIDTEHGAARITAVIDFGDLTAGDPASDLGVAWLHFTPEGRARFRLQLEVEARYGADAWVRARGWALHYGTLMALLPIRDPLHGVGIHALEQVLEE